MYVLFIFTNIFVFLMCNLSFVFYSEFSLLKFLCMFLFVRVFIQGFIVRFVVRGIFLFIVLLLFQYVYGKEVHLINIFLANNVFRLKFNMKKQNVNLF